MILNAAILTKHDKARLVAPSLSRLGWLLSEVSNFDTDTLGSFAGEYPRFMSPVECAMRKAAIAADLSGLNLGIGSEGSFSVGPYGIGTFNLELLSCVNIDAGWVVTGKFYGPTTAQRWTITQKSELDIVLQSLPAGQKLLLQQQQQIYKGISAEHALSQVVTLLKKGSLELSYDLRAHCCPERQLHIISAADNLAARLQRTCPKCQTPGFWPNNANPGLPCEECSTPTTLTLQREACCQRCHYTETYAVEATIASRQYCQVCNP